MTGAVRIEDGKSIARGIPLAEEEGIGALTLGGYVREICDRYADREAAVIHLDGGVTRWTYSDLLDRSQEVARALIAAGVGKGTRVGIIATNRLEFLSCLFGTALSGGVATTISTFFTGSEIDEVLKAAGCSVLLVERKVLKKDFGDVLLELEPGLKTSAPGEIVSLRFPYLRHVAFVDTDEGEGAIEGWRTFLDRGNDVSNDLVDATAASVAPSDPGLLFFSSGSTGKAKGILAAHRAPCLQLWRWPQWYGIDPALPARTWSANGFFFSGNFAMTLGSALSSGGTIVLQRWFDAEEAVALMEMEKTNMAIAWPHQWPQLADAPNYATADLSAMHYVSTTMPISDHPTINSTWEEPGHAYGSTETFTLITVLPANTPEEVHRGSFGVPTAGSTVKIVEPLTGETVPIGERGEVAVKGPTLMLGYIGIPLDDTLDDEGYFRTSDGGYLDAEGRLFWEGRLNDIIKTGGANVSPVEIDAILRDHPKVKISQTVGVPDELLGELVVTCIVPAEGTSPDEAEVKAYAKEKLAAFKIPRKVLFVEEADLQTTGSAKIKTADLRKLAAARLQEQAPTG
ncbi:MAG: AMP-binding protein [Novosphingobium sp.]|nr:AMP-binding protein [Novosphingobium sp.]